MLATKLYQLWPHSDLYIPSKFTADPNAFYFSSPLGEVVGDLFNKYCSLVLIMALGIAVRSVAGHLKDKYTDPGVVVVDDAGRFAISLVGGHSAGANAVATKVAALIGAEPVITTAKDATKTLAADLVDQNFGRDIDEEYHQQGERAVWEPESLVVGIGCNRKVTSREIGQAIHTILPQHGLSHKSIRNLATIDLKRDEPGLIDWAEQNGLAIEFFSREELCRVPGMVNPSRAVYQAIGVAGVCEAAALISSGATELVLPKIKSGNITLAVARVVFTPEA